MSQSKLYELARTVTEGADIDWESAEATTNQADREALRQLRLVASIGRAARQLAAKWGPLEIRQQIGHGTYGTVYRAWDPKVDREVALKLLTEGTIASSGAGVIHEARLLASVEHPNIVPVYGADVHDGRVGIWMKFIHGKTLKDVLIEQGPFSAEEAALVGRDICQALAAVHKHGLLHRDIKAQNVMREVGGRTVLMDFGSGQLAEVAKDDPVMGSPAYLAPEVVAGETPTSRSDIYSLAVLLYHIVSGEFPVTAGSWDELRGEHAQGRVRLLRDVRPDLPAWFISAVDHGLATDPRRRPLTAGAMAAQLQLDHHSRAWINLRALAVSVLLVVVVGVGWWLWSQSQAANTAVTKSSIAILPFENLTGAPELDYLGPGLARQVASRLSRIAGIRVAVPSNVLQGDATRAIGSQLGVEAVLTCAIRGSSQFVRLNCHIRSSDSNDAVWTDTSDHKTEDVVALESELARRVAFAMTGPLTADENRRLLDGLVSPEALSLYFKGRHEWTFRTEQSLNRSISYYLAAIRAEPDFALAYSGLADTYTLLGAYGFLARPVAYSRAFEAAERAVALDATLPESHFSLGYAQKNRFDWSGAEASFRRGLELNPDSSTGHHWFSIHLSQLGRFTEAIGEAKLAMSLDPSSLAARTNFAALLMMARRYRDAIAEWESCIQLGSNQVNTYRAMSKAYLYVGDRERALEFAEEAQRRAMIGAADEELKADLAYVYASIGRPNEAVALANELILRYRAAGEGIAGSIAAIYTALGQYEEALTWLSAAERDRDPELGYLFVDPKWDVLRKDARFQTLLVNLGFPIK